MEGIIDELYKLDCIKLVILHSKMVENLDIIII